MTDDELRQTIERAVRFFEGEVLERLLPRGEAEEATRAALAPPDAAERAARRFAERWDETLSRLRSSPATGVTLLGREAVDALVRAAGDLEPSEAAIRALFAERAAEALLASLLYDGIVEFMKKMNSLGDKVPGVSFAKKLGGGLFGGLASGVSGAFVEQQVKTFLQGFVKIALERGVAFMTSPANRAVFRETRERLARRLLERPLRDLVAQVPDDRSRAVRDDIAGWIRGRMKPDAALGTVKWIYDRFGRESAASFADRYGLTRLDPRDAAKLLLPGWKAFLEKEAPK